MTLKVPSKNSKVVPGKGTTYQEMRVEVRIYKAGGSNKQYQSNHLRKCGRCLRYFPKDQFSQMTIDELVPMQIEVEGEARKHRGICNDCCGTIQYVTEGEKEDKERIEEQKMTALN